MIRSDNGDRAGVDSSRCHGWDGERAGQGQKVEYVDMVTYSVEGAMARKKARLSEPADDRSDDTVKVKAEPVDI